MPRPRREEGDLVPTIDEAFHEIEAEPLDAAVALGRHLEPGWRDDRDPHWGHGTCSLTTGTSRGRRLGRLTDRPRIGRRRCGGQVSATGSSYLACTGAGRRSRPGS